MEHILTVRFTRADQNEFRGRLGTEWRRIVEAITKAVKQSLLIATAIGRTDDCTNPQSNYLNGTDFTIEVPFSTDDVHHRFQQMSEGQRAQMRALMQLESLKVLNSDMIIGKMRKRAFITFCEDNRMYFLKGKLPENVQNELQSKDCNFFMLHQELMKQVGEGCSYAFLSSGNGRMKVPAEVIEKVLADSAIELPNEQSERIGLMVRVAEKYFPTPFSEREIIERATEIMYPEDGGRIVPQGKSSASKIDTEWFDREIVRHYKDHAELSAHERRTLCSCVRNAAKEHNLGHLDQDNSNMDKVFEEALKKFEERRKANLEKKLANRK